MKSPHRSRGASAVVRAVGEAALSTHDDDLLGSLGSWSTCLAWPTAPLPTSPLGSLAWGRGEPAASAAARGATAPAGTARKACLSGSVAANSLQRSRPVSGDA